MQQPDLEKGLLKYKGVENNEQENEEKRMINCPCVIGSTFTTIICGSLLWLIIRYN